MTDVPSDPRKFTIGWLTCRPDPDIVAVAECFASREAHERHLHGETFRDCWKRLHEFCIDGRFENIFVDHVEPDRADFTAAR